MVNRFNIPQAAYNNQLAIVSILPAASCLLRYNQPVREPGADNYQNLRERDFIGEDEKIAIKESIYCVFFVPD